MLATAETGELHGHPRRAVAEPDLPKLLATGLAGQMVLTIGARRGLHGRRRLLARQVEAHTDQARALLERVGGRALQIKPDVERRARLARALHLLRAELL